jgi:hypothetical protein
MKKIGYWIPIAGVIILCRDVFARNYLFPFDEEWEPVFAMWHILTTSVPVALIWILWL